MHALAALGNVKTAKETLKEEKVQTIFENDGSDSLFPKEFDDHLKLMKGTRQNLVNHFKPVEDKKKKKDATSKTSATVTKGQSQRQNFHAPQQPFRGFPSSRGGFSSGRSNSYYGKNPFYNSNKKGQGKHASNPFRSTCFHLQTGCQISNKSIQVSRGYFQQRR